MDVAFFSDLEQMLDKADLDAVFVCTPPFSHLPIAQECVDRKVHVFVEKPLAESCQSAKKMASLVSSSDIVNATGYTLAHIPLYKKAKDMLAKGILGNIHRFGISVYFSQVLSRKKGWFYDKSKSGGGVVIDIASHLLFLVTWYFGLPRKIYALTLNFYSDVEDCGSILFDYENGLTGILDANWSIPGYRLATITITEEGENGFTETTNDYIKLNLLPPPAFYRMLPDGGKTPCKLEGRAGCPTQGEFFFFLVATCVAFPRTARSGHPLGNEFPEIFFRDSQKSFPPNSVALRTGFEVCDTSRSKFFPEVTHFLSVPDFLEGGVFHVSRDEFPEEILGAGKNFAIPEYDQSVPWKGTDRVFFFLSFLFDPARPIVHFSEDDRVQRQIFEPFL
jgi:hypothetical protein